MGGWIFDSLQEFTLKTTFGIRAKKTGLNARRVEQGGFTSQETEKNQKVLQRVIRGIFA